MRKLPGPDGCCQVTFTLPAEVHAESVYLCGEFNHWSTTAMPMDQDDNGTFEVAVVLETGRNYRFRYLLDGTRWENDWAADDYAANDFGGDDSVVSL